MRVSARLQDGGLIPSRRLARRFVPPWERDGKTAEEFFGGILQSANPIQTQRKQAERQRAYEEGVAVDDAFSPEEHRQLAAMETHNATVAEERRQFLPYGATPRRYFDTADMAAWGAYEAALRAPPRGLSSAADTSSSSSSFAQTEGYSAAVQTQLLADMNSKIPYRYDSYVPPPSGGVKNKATASSSLQWPLHGSAGLVLDIDGVVYRSRQLIPGADTAIQHLVTLRIPFVFMTNGGSKSESEKAAELSELLGCEVDPRQVLMSHSPMQLLAPLYADQRVLIVGNAHCAEVAREDYGFRRAMSVQQFQCEHPELVPFKQWGNLKTAEPGKVPFPEFAAVLQMDDPVDAFNDAQSVLDVLLAPGGRFGPYVSGVQTTPYCVAADDLLWATSAPLPRLGQGAFREMMSSVFESVTGEGMQTQMYGKPRAIAYAYAEQRLKEVSAALGWDPHQLRSIFMVGDNIETDVVGANAASGLWTSVHVLSGIGRAPAARRTLGAGDEELEWLETCVEKTPHYIAPTLDHFVRELLAFPETAMLQNRISYRGKPNPVDLKEMYNFSL